MYKPTEVKQSKAKKEQKKINMRIEIDKVKQAASEIGRERCLFNGHKQKENCMK